MEKTLFTFTKIFDEKSSQVDIFVGTSRKLISNIFDQRKSGLLFAYGITNSGKSYTICGTKDNPGILPQSIRLILESVKREDFTKFKVPFSMVELYNDEAYDLLSLDAKNQKTKVNRDFLSFEKLSLVEIMSYENFLLDYIRAIFLRQEASNGRNENSSRSHVITKIYLLSVNQKEKISLTVVDLAGNDRNDNLHENNQIKSKESCFINQSLHLLRLCLMQMKMNSLSKNQQNHVSFRDCLLTKLLSSSFKENQNVQMILNINQGIEFLGEKLHSLDYATLAGQITESGLAEK